MNVVTIDRDVHARFNKEVRLNPKVSNVAWFWSLDEEEHLTLTKELKFETLEDVAEELSQVDPCFITLVYEYKRDDGRTSRPLVFISYQPTHTSFDLSVRYSSSKRFVVERLGVQGLSYDVHDPDEIDDEWLQDHLKKDLR